MTRKEDINNVNRQEIFKSQITEREREIIDGLFGVLKQNESEFHGVNWTVFLAGDFADSFEHRTSKPDNIDLRIAVNAPSSSDWQLRTIKTMEAIIDDHLKSNEVPYIQKTGENWHLIRKSYEPDCHEYEKYLDSGHNDIRFLVIPDYERDLRRTDIVINKFAGRNIDEQIKWEKEYRHRQPIILADSRNFISYK